MGKFEEFGYEIHENIFDDQQIHQIIRHIEQQNKTNDNHRSNGGLFAIREFLMEYPDIIPFLNNQKLFKIIQSLGENFKIIRSIYFDKPPKANWIVNWHQDLTINVDKKINRKDFKNWRILKNKVVTQPPLKILENIFTIRIHLDHCNRNNGALQIIPESHKKGIIPITELTQKDKKHAIFCELNKGGVLLMKPLLLHFSKRTDNNQRRRVIHLELTNQKLPDKLNWKEEINIDELITCA